MLFPGNVSQHIILLLLLHLRVLSIDAALSCPRVGADLFFLFSFRVLFGAALPAFCRAHALLEALQAVQTEMVHETMLATCRTRHNVTAVARQPLVRLTQAFLAVGRPPLGHSHQQPIPPQ